MLELWKEVLDDGKSVGAIFMGLSKAFDTLNLELLTAKLKAYRFSKNYLNYIQSYLRNRLQRANVNKLSFNHLLALLTEEIFCNLIVRNHWTWTRKISDCFTGLWWPRGAIVKFKNRN